MNSWREFSLNIQLHNQNIRRKKCFYTVLTQGVQWLLVLKETNISLKLVEEF